ncbi:MAG: hypothetical protein KF832_15780 [Caldilineaceae bacterium]|nr:hypothetical protein [Caldilineaceae bacterium]
MSSPRLIRVGLLCIPMLDDEAVTTVFRALQRAHPAVLVMTAAALSQRNWIEEILRTWCDVEELDLVLTIGGTLPAPGPSAREVVPEATHHVIERAMPGLAESMRYHAQAESNLAWLERGIVGIRGRSLVVNLPAGAAPALLFLEAILELIPVVIAHLQDEPNVPQLQDEVALTQAIPDEVGFLPTTPAVPGKGLRPEEFAAFLARKQAP